MARSHDGAVAEYYNGVPSQYYKTVTRYYVMNQFFDEESKYYFEKVLTKTSDEAFAMSPDMTKNLNSRVRSWYRMNCDFMYDLHVGGSIEVLKDRMNGHHAQIVPSEEELVIMMFLASPCVDRTF